MKIQKQSWEKVKKFILNLEITHGYFSHDDGIIKTPLEVLKNRELLIPNLDRFVFLINGKTQTESLIFFDSLISDLKNEIKVNIDLKLGKENLLPYFEDIYSTIQDVTNRLIFDEIRETWNYDTFSYHPDFEEYDLLEKFRFNKSPFLSELNTKIVNLELFLLTINEYNEIRKNDNRSPLGNVKIEWKKQVNQLVDFYLKLLQEGLIETDRDNLAPFIINNFTHRGSNLSEHTIKTYLDPNREMEKLPKQHKKIDPKDFL